MKFEDQIVLHEDSLTNFAYQLSKDADYSKDLVQETFLKALKNKRKYKPGTNLKHG